jgi:hypothetical protein
MPPAEPKLIRVLKYVPGNLMVGEDIEGVRRKLKLYAREPLSEMPKKALARQTYGEGMRDLAIRVQDEMVIPKTGRVDNAMLALLEKDPNVKADLYSDYLINQYNAEHPLRKVPPLGPVYRGGQSILLHDLTHESEGVDEHGSVWPAFDDGWRAGRAVIAPENLTVIDQSGSQGGDAFFARGVSELEYWFGHLAVAPATGRKFRKGQTMGVIANIPLIFGGPHVHTGINALPLIGKDFLHHTDYSHGAPTVVVQLRKWAEAA